MNENQFRILLQELTALRRAIEALGTLYEEKADTWKTYGGGGNDDGKQ